MKRSFTALTVSLVLTAAASSGGVTAAEPTAAAVFMRGMTEVCAPWQAGAGGRTLYASLKKAGWNVDVTPKLDGPWGSAQFQPSKAEAGRGCSAMLTLAGESGRAATTKAVLGWVARTYPGATMTNQEKPVQLAAGPVRAWSWVDGPTAIIFYAADTVSATSAPHLVLSVKPR